MYAGVRQALNRRIVVARCQGLPGRRLRARAAAATVTILNERIAVAAQAAQLLHGILTVEYLFLDEVR